MLVTTAPLLVTDRRFCFVMKLPSSDNFRWYGLVTGLAAVLVLLALLQYRSTKAIGQATAEEMRSSLQGSLMDVRQGLEREFTPLCRELQLGPEGSHSRGLRDYAAGFERWRRAAAHPNLVLGVFLWRQGNGPHEVLKLNSSHTDFETTGWPEELSGLHDRLQQLNPTPGGSDGGPTGRSLQFLGDGRPPSEPPNGGPPRDNGRSFQGGPESPPSGVPEEDRMRHSAGPHEIGQGPPPAPMPTPPWMIDENTPALVHLTYEDEGSDTHGPRAPAPIWIILTLNREIIGQHILPELVQRYFGSKPSYEIAVVDHGRHGPILYSSDAEFGQQQPLHADASVGLFGPPPVFRSRPSPQRFDEPENSPTRRSPARRDDPTEQTGFHDEGMFRIEPVHYAQLGQEWEIVAKHREGSVEAAVAALTRRNLMFNFAVLLVLAATMGMIIVTSQRARRLGELQMDFVANVSHELRTPLTAIISAAQNIADGVVRDKERTAQYGRAIVGQGQQLTELVEQILLFSATQKDRHRYHLEAVNVANIIAASLQSMSTLIRSSAITVAQEIQPGLPPVLADFKALSQCLQNLIGNAVKYGGDGRWMGVSASVEQLPDGRKEVQISVSDKGIGISREDLRHIFEPFYRSPQVSAAQIHGSGLGLPLAKSIAEAMGGRLTVDSTLQKGSKFTIYLPAA